MQSLLVHADAVIATFQELHGTKVLVRGTGLDHMHLEGGRGRVLTFCFTFRKSSTRNRLQRWMTYSLCQAQRCQSRTRHCRSGACGLAGARDSKPAAAAWTRKHWAAGCALAHL